MELWGAFVGIMEGTTGATGSCEATENCVYRDLWGYQGTVGLWEFVGLQGT